MFGNNILTWYTKDNQNDPHMGRASRHVLINHFRHEGYKVVDTTDGPWPITVMTKPVLGGVSMVHIGECTGTINGKLVA